MARKGGNPDIAKYGKKITKENAREMQKKSVEAYHEHQTAKELLQEELDKRERKRKGMDKLADAYADGDMQAIKLAQDILDENENVLNIKTDGFKIEVTSQKTAKELQKIMDDE